MISITASVEGLEEIIEDLEQAPARVTLALGRSVNPKRWKEKATVRANQVLTAMAETGEEHNLVAKLAGTITVAFWEMSALGMKWEMSAPVEGLEVEEVLGAQQLGDLLRFGNREEVNRLMQFLVAWVKTEKRKDGRDRRGDGQMKSDADIALGLFYILMGGSEERDAGRAALLPHIQKFIDVQTKEVVGPERLEQWLHAVLDGWAELAIEQAPEVMADEALKEFRPNRRKH